MASESCYFFHSHGLNQFFPCFKLELPTDQKLKWLTKLPTAVNFCLVFIALESLEMKCDLKNQMYFI